MVQVGLLELTVVEAEYEEQCVEVNNTFCALILLESLGWRRRKSKRSTGLNPRVARPSPLRMSAATPRCVATFDLPPLGHLFNGLHTLLTRSLSHAPWQLAVDVWACLRMPHPTNILARWS